MEVVPINRSRFDNNGNDGNGHLHLKIIMINDVVADFMFLYWWHSETCVQNCYVKPGPILLGLSRYPWSYQNTACRLAKIYEHEGRWLWTLSPEYQYSA